MSLLALNENGMQGTPHTPFPHCTKPHCVPPCTPHPASKRQITTTTEGEKMNEDEWMCPFHHLPTPLCAHTTLQSLPSKQSASLHVFFLCSHPLLTPNFAVLCYDCGQCVLHTYLLAPLLCRGALIKHCHFQRSGMSPSHKCCPDTWSGKIKTACLTISVLCLSTVAWLLNTTVSDVLSLIITHSSYPFLSSLPSLLLLGNLDSQLV